MNQRQDHLTLQKKMMGFGDRLSIMAIIMEARTWCMEAPRYSPERRYALAKHEIPNVCHKSWAELFALCVYHDPGLLEVNETRALQQGSIDACWFCCTCPPQIPPIARSHVFPTLLARPYDSDR